MEIIKYTEKQILGISITDPEFLFRDKEAIAKDMLALSNKWGANKDTMAHIILLFKEAKKKIESNTWVEPNKVIIKLSNTDIKKFKYFTKHNFELGTTYIGSKHFVTFVDTEWVDAHSNFVRIPKYFQYPNAALEKDTKISVPTFTSIKDNSDRLGFLIPKPNDFLYLKDVNNHFNNNIPWAHVAWIISRCMHLACWLEYSQLFYGGFSQDNIFICPEFHTIGILTGWWYATPIGNNITLANRRMLDSIPNRLLNKNNKVAQPIMDRFLIRRLLCELLNDPTGQSLIRNKTVAEPIEQWINMPPVAKAQEDYKLWYKALEDAHGKRRFTKLELTEKNLYDK